VGRPPAALAGARTLFVNEREALGLSGAPTVEEAAAMLAEQAETVVVTLAAEGAIACTGGEIVAAAAERVEQPLDTTGAGDVLVAAYVWADLRGADPADRLRWAVLYASLAVTTPTGVGGALREAELLEAGAARGLTAPPFAGVAQV
jgi:sugar/nucleoside kinase (ribokinase family)